MGFSLLAGPLTKSGSVQNIFRNSQIRLWKCCASTLGQRSGRLDRTPAGLLGAASVTPLAFSTWGDPPRSRSPPHLQAAQIKTAAENSFSTCTALPALSASLMTLEPIPQFQNRRQVFFPLYIWSTESSCCLYTETWSSLLLLFFIYLPPLSPANSYPLFKLQLRCLESSSQRSLSGSQE